MLRRNIARYAGPQPNPFKKLLGSLAGGEQYFKLRDLDSRVESLPFSVRVLLESAVRNCDEFDITTESVEKILDWKKNATQQIEVPFKPARVVLQDFTGVPCVVDLAAMRDAVKRLGGDPNKINPLIPVDLVIDHSVAVDYFGKSDSLNKNQNLEMQRNYERFRFLKWGSKAFNNLTIVPPGSGIIHQINVEYLARVVFNNNNVLYPDSVVGTDSHTTMINGVGVVGWGVGGIEAEAGMLGQSLSLVLPKVVGYRLTGKPREGVTATDVVLRCTKELRKHGVVGKFVEYHGDGLDNLSLADRATIANMAPEYGATIGFFPVDDETLNFLKCSGRDPKHLGRIEAYSRAAGMYRTGAEKIHYTEELTLDLGTVEPSVSGPKRPHDHIPVSKLKSDFKACLDSPMGFKGFGLKKEDINKSIDYKMADGTPQTMKHGDVVIAAITSCTNTSNPAVLIAAGLVAKKARALGLKIKPSVKTSFSPGSHVVSRYLANSGLQAELDAMGFNVTGYGCMTCIGNSGPLDEGVQNTIVDHGMAATAVLSGNRNFEARVHQNVAGAYLASPPLVVAYALAGRVDIDFDKEELAPGVTFKDIWPSNAEIKAIIDKYVTPQLFTDVYKDIDALNPDWKKLEAPEGQLYQWEETSTYIHNPPYFTNLTREVNPSTKITGAKVLLNLGDSITTDHISPAGNIAPTSPAARFLKDNGVERADFNTYGSRRGNDLVMVRGTFANVRIRNKMMDGEVGPFTLFEGKKMPIYDAAAAYKEKGIPTVVLAGKEYGSGSSRDWAAKGPFLQGIKVVIAESYERIHRSNLVGMGIVPLQFKDGKNADSLGFDGTETFDFDFSGDLKPCQDFTVTAIKKDGSKVSFATTLRIDTQVEFKFFEHGGILNYVLRNKIAS